MVIAQMARASPRPENEPGEHSTRIKIASLEQANKSSPRDPTESPDSPGKPASRLARPKGACKRLAHAAYAQSKASREAWS